MDITLFYALFSATCFALLGFWWNLLQGSPHWLRDPATRSAVGGVYASFLLPALMGLFAQVGGSGTSTIWRISFVVIAVVGLAVNVVGAWLLHRGARESLNVRAAYLEVVSDALSSLAVLAAAVVVITTGLTVADPLASGAIALLIVPRTWRLLRQAVNVLLEGTPAHLELGEIELAMTSVPGVRRVHDLHVWTLTSGREAMSAHVVVADVRESERLLEALHALLHARFGIDHTTIQLETEPPPVLRIKGPNPV